MRESILETSAPEADRAGPSTSSIAPNPSLDPKLSSEDEDPEISTGFDFTWGTNHHTPELQVVSQLGKEQSAAHTMTFLGADLDTLSNRVSLPQAKVAPLIWKIRRLMTATSLPARVCLSIIGSMSATLPMIQWAPWHMRTMQTSFLAQWNETSMLQA